MHTTYSLSLSVFPCCVGAFGRCLAEDSAALRQMSGIRFGVCRPVSWERMDARLPCRTADSKVDTVTRWFYYRGDPVRISVVRPCGQPCLPHADSVFMPLVDGPGQSYQWGVGHCEKPESLYDLEFSHTKKRIK